MGSVTGERPGSRELLSPHPQPGPVPPPALWAALRSAHEGPGSVLGAQLCPQGAPGFLVTWLLGRCASWAAFNSGDRDAPNSSCRGPRSGACSLCRHLNKSAISARVSVIGTYLFECRQCVGR